MSKKKNSDAMPSPSAEENDYETERHARTLLEAETIKADPAKMKKVNAHLEKQRTAITSIQGLKDRYNDGVKAKKKETFGDGSDAGT